MSAQCGLRGRRTTDDVRTTARARYAVFLTARRPSTHHARRGSCLLPPVAAAEGACGRETAASSKGNPWGAVDLQLATPLERWRRAGTSRVRSEDGGADKAGQVAVRLGALPSPQRSVHISLVLSAARRKRILTKRYYAYTLMVCASPPRTCLPGFWTARTVRARVMVAAAC